MKKNKFIFFCGTVAEFIKLFPVIREMELNGIDYVLVFTGQNNIESSDLYPFITPKEILKLSEKQPHQSPVGLLIWFIKTFFIGFFKLASFVRKNREHGFVVLVHGDTISSVLGAYLSKLLGLVVVHIEAGLRSFNLLRPFPEEISRVLVSKVADISFCPNEWAANNLKNSKKMKIFVTVQNTLLDSMNFSLSNKVEHEIFSRLPERFFIFVVHRQENIYNKALVELLVKKILEISNTLKCVFILHRPTLHVLKKLNLIDEILSNPNIIPTERLPYMVFVHLLNKSEFIITDGGSNQEESYYLGKPCLILRKETERIEGIGENAVLSKLDYLEIEKFISSYEKFKRDRLRTDVLPSKIIFKILDEMFISGHEEIV